MASDRAPKPEEPTGLGAVVTDADNVTWVRVQTENAAPWMRADAARMEIDRPYRYWDGIAATEIHSEGVTP